MDPCDLFKMFFYRNFGFLQFLVVGSRKCVDTLMCKKIESQSICTFLFAIEYVNILNSDWE